MANGDNRRYHPVMHDDRPRPGEVRLPFDPATRADDARLIFIGRILSPWTERSQCPKSLRAAREKGRAARVEIDEPWRPGLSGLASGMTIVVLYWMDRARRDLIVQAPSHRDVPTGAFALRSPVRPNPVSLAVVRLLAVDAGAGRLTIDAIDALDGTPVLDIKPWFGDAELPPPPDAED